MMIGIVCNVCRKTVTQLVTTVASVTVVSSGQLIVADVQLCNWCKAVVGVEYKQPPPLSASPNEMRHQLAHQEIDRRLNAQHERLVMLESSANDHTARLDILKAQVGEALLLKDRVVRLEAQGSKKPVFDEMMTPVHVLPKAGVELSSVGPNKQYRVTITEVEP